MSKLIDIFSWQRFLRVLANDLLLLEARRIAFASLGLFFIGMIVYVSNVTEIQDANQYLALGLFHGLLIGGGLIFTSMIFNDMHHPLERFHYLTLPCSNLERFVSRYLITALLYTLYAIVFFKLFEAIANVVCAWLWDTTMPLLDLGAIDTQRGILGYFITHVFVFTGAVWFRSYSLIKTLATSMLFWTACGIVGFLAIRVVYWDSFISFFEMNPAGPYPNVDFDFGENGFMWYHKLLLTAFLLWTLFLAYLGLKEHEVQDGL